MCVSGAAEVAPASRPRAPGAPGGGKGRAAAPRRSAGAAERHRFTLAGRAARAAVLDPRESTLRHPLAAEPGLGVRLGGGEYFVPGQRFSLFSELQKHQQSLLELIALPIPRVSDLGRSGVGQGIYTSNKCPGVAQAAGLGL